MLPADAAARANHDGGQRMSYSEIVAIDAVRRVAKEAAERGLLLNDACPWPYDSSAGQFFKREFIFHRAALEALARSTPEDTEGVEISTEQSA